MNLATFPQQLGSKFQKLAIEQILVLSFGMFILAGSLALLLPAATTGPPLGFIDALFTSTSATCVTGLVVVDTGLKFTLLGQILILVMIQAGGLGIVTFSTALLYVLERRLSIGSKDLLFETLSQGPVPNIRKLLKMVFISTCAFEGIGSIVLSLRFMSDMPLGKAIYYGIFHSISAFCNAGFALFPDSLTAYRNDLTVNITIAALIILGGLGFIVIYELAHFKSFKFRRLSYHTRIVLFMTLLLILVGALLFFILEIKNSIQGFPLRSKIITSIFQSITARTAGFNTLDFGHLSNPTLFIIICLMFIGASPSSCGGGIKVTTAIVFFSLLRSRFHNQDMVNLFNRRIHTETVSKAISIGFFSILFIVAGTMLLLVTELSGIAHTESRGLFLELLFEATSAFGTVGLSVGITPTLTTFGKIIITLMMFIGRLGALTVIMTIGRKQKQLYKYAQERVLIG